MAAVLHEKWARVGKLRSQRAGVCRAYHVNSASLAQVKVSIKALRLMATSNKLNAFEIGEIVDDLAATLEQHDIIESTMAAQLDTIDDLDGRIRG